MKCFAEGGIASTPLRTIAEAGKGFAENAPELESTGYLVEGVKGSA